jgi:RIO kinase 2
VECIRTFFKRRFQYESTLYPTFKRVWVGENTGFRLDVAVEASGFNKKDMKILEEVCNEGLYVRTRLNGTQYMEATKEDPDDNDDCSDSEESTSSVDTSHSDKAEHSGPEHPSSPLLSPAMPSTKELKSLESDISKDSNSERKVDSSSPLPSSEEGDGESGSDDSAVQAPRKPRNDEIKNKVASHLASSTTKQQRKYHSKKSSRRAGRPAGSKAKQDKRIKMDSTGFWD